MAFSLTVADPQRFRRSRDVGSWVGLCPRVRASGDSNPQLSISKAGDGFLRRLLVQSAHHILDPFGRDSDLRRFGLRLLERGGKRAKRRAVVWDINQPMRAFHAETATPLTVEIDADPTEPQLNPLDSSVYWGFVTKTFSVVCTDADSGRPIDADVFLGSDWAGLTNSQITACFSYSALVYPERVANETTQPRLFVSRQGYVDKEVDYSWHVTR